mmetsp:Transcript_32184/g.78947  ORF Transcript_32184/g.78947 Transcript_32184/m.78947 type:complete len:390 (+) Transcript_32184:502-1671(+)
MTMPAISPPPRPPPPRSTTSSPGQESMGTSKRAMAPPEAVHEVTGMLESQPPLGLKPGLLNTLAGTSTSTRSALAGVVTGATQIVSQLPVSLLSQAWRIIMSDAWRRRSRRETAKRIERCTKPVKSKLRPPGRALPPGMGLPVVAEKSDASLEVDTIELAEKVLGSMKICEIVLEIEMMYRTEGLMVPPLVRRCSVPVVGATPPPPPPPPVDTPPPTGPELAGSSPPASVSATTKLGSTTRPWFWNVGSSAIAAVRPVAWLLRVWVISPTEPKSSSVVWISGDTLEPVWRSERSKKPRLASVMSESRMEMRLRRTFLRRALQNARRNPSLLPGSNQNERGLLKLQRIFHLSSRVHLQVVGFIVRLPVQVPQQGLVISYSKRVRFWVELM